MLLVTLCFLLFCAVAGTVENDPVADQLVLYKREHPLDKASPKNKDTALSANPFDVVGDDFRRKTLLPIFWFMISKSPFTTPLTKNGVAQLIGRDYTPSSATNFYEPRVLTTSVGAPVEQKQATNTLNSNLLTNEYFVEELTQFIRSKIPERVVHAKGAGAFGYFQVTHDITDVCKSKLFSKVGKKTPVAVRFSHVDPERGVSDLSRGTKGFAVKFYTEDGNFDIVAIDFPVFVFDDPLLFSTFGKAAQKNPSTNVLDANTLWDFLTTNPESLFLFLYFFGDPGIPDGYRHIPGYSVHTYQVVNQKGVSYFIRYHILPNAGLKYIQPEEAKELNDPDYATRDLYRAIGKGDYPSWNISIQVLSLDDVKTTGFSVFDVTKILPLQKYPLRPVGILVLNKNPENYFAQIEQMAFSPANYVNGMFGAPDKVFEARRLAYRNTQYHRLGANFNKITVNCPFQTKAFTYNRDGAAPVDENGADSPNYFPNTFNGPQPYVDTLQSKELIEILQKKSDNFEQAKDYIESLTEDEISRLIKNIVNSLRHAASNLQERAIELYTTMYPKLGSRIAAGLNC